MKAALLLFALAAMLSWASLELGKLGAAPTIVAATRTAPPPAPTALVDTIQSAPPPALEAAAPLFRPAALPAALREPQPGEAFALVGLAGGADDRVAFLRDEADQRTFTARTGEDVRDWTIEDASDRCVVLRRAQRRQTICLS